MAYGLKKISPLDLRTSTAIGVNIPFSAQNVFTSVYTTKEQTKYNLINFLLTDKGERPFSPYCTEEEILGWRNELETLEWTYEEPVPIKKSEEDYD